MHDDLSHVGIEQHLCPVCRELHDVGVLLDKRLRKSLPRRVTNGMSLCPRHRKVAEDEDRVYLCEADPDKSDKHSVFFCAGVAAIRMTVYEELIADEHIDRTRERRFMLVVPEVFRKFTQIIGATEVPDDHPSINPPQEYDA